MPRSRLSLAAVLPWRRVVFTGLACALLLLPLSIIWRSDFRSLSLRVLVTALAALLIFGALERWPRNLPDRISRWMLQVAAVAMAIPACLFVLYVVGTPEGAPPFWRDIDRLGGFGVLSVFGLMLAPWLALSSVVRQKESEVRQQALAFSLERSELERSALDARLHQLQAQVQPHFLFNTLANVRALVAAGSPQAPALLDHLIAYLRAAVPRLGETDATLAQELGLVRSYLALMHMRMPDRLRYAMEVSPGDDEGPCLPMAVLTLVENAVRHGIDPSEEGGRVDIRIRRDSGGYRIEVRDTGIGAADLREGSGLRLLRERLRLAYGERAELSLTDNAPHGLAATLSYPLEARA